MTWRAKEILGARYPAQCLAQGGRVFLLRDTAAGFLYQRSGPTSCSVPSACVCPPLPLTLHPEAALGQLQVPVYLIQVRMSEAEPASPRHVVGSSPDTGDRFRCWAPNTGRKMSLHKIPHMLSHKSEKMPSQAACEARQGAERTRCSANPVASQKLC